MGRECEPSTVFRAQELYCVDRLPMERVREILVAELGDEAPAMSTLWRWSEKYGWPAKREEIAQALSEIAADTVLARAGMLKELIKSKDAQVGFAVASLENLAIKQAEAARAGRVVQAQLEAAERREIKTPEDAAAALQEAVEQKLAAMLADPAQVDLKAVKNIMEAMDAVATLRPKDAEAAAAARDKGLSVNTAEEILNKILMGK